MLALLKNTVEYELKQFDYERTEQEFKVWSLNVEGTVSEDFHAVRLISLVYRVKGMNCYVDFNAAAKRCELTIF